MLLLEIKISCKTEHDLKSHRDVWAVEIRLVFPWYGTVYGGWSSDLEGFFVNGLKSVLYTTSYIRG